MATFNAGAIEARLTLDRSAFTRELREARAQADAFERDDINVRVVTDSSSLPYLQEQLRSIGDQAVYVSVYAESRELDRLQERMRELRNATVQIGVRVRDDEITDLEARLDALRERTLTVDLDVDSSAAATLESYMRNLGDKTVRIEFEVGSLDALMEAEALANAIRDERITLDIDIDAGGDLAALEALIQGLPSTINIDVDIAMALLKLDILASAIFAVRVEGERPINIDVDTAMARAQVALLKQQLDELDTVVNTGVLGSGAGGGGGGGGGRGSIIFLVLKIILAMAPLVVVAITGIVAAVVALGAALAGAAGGAGILIAGFVGVIKKYNEMSDAAKNAAGPVGEFTSALKDIKREWADFISNIQNDAFATLAVGARVLADAMPALHPLFHAFNVVLRDALTAVGAFVNSPEFDRMITFFATTGVQAFEGFLAIGGNLILFFGRLFEAFGPFAVSMVDGLAEITAGWAEWADGLGQTEGFKTFIDYVSENGPKMLDMLGSLVDAFINIGVAVAPLAGPMMTIFTAIFDFVAGIDPSILGAIAVAIGAIMLSLKAFNVVMAITNAIMALSPWGAVALLIIGLVAAFVYLWKTNEGFRDALKAAWQAIKDAWNSLVDAFQAGMAKIDEIWESLKRGVSNLKTNIDSAWGAIKQIFANAWEAIKINVSSAWDAIKQIFSAAWTNLKTNVQSAWDAIKQIFTAGWDNLKTNVTAAWEAIKQIFTAAWSNLKTNVQSAWDAIKQIFSAAWTAIDTRIDSAVASMKSAISGAWESIKTNFSNATSSIKTTVSDAFGSIVSTVTSKVGSFMEIIRGIPGKITAAFSNFGSLLTGAGRALMDGLASGVRDAGQRVIDAAQAVVRKVKDLLPGSPIRSGPLLSWNNGGAGKRLMGMLAGGIEAGGPLVSGAMAATLKDMTDIAGMRMGGAGFIQGRLGIDSGTPSVTPQVSVSTQAPDLSAMVAEQRATREAMSRMVNAYDKMVDQQLVLARQGAI